MNILYLDLETTGLNPGNRGRIVEVGAIACRLDERMIQELGTFEAVIGTDMEDWAYAEQGAVRMHISNGLSQESLDSRLTLEEVDSALAVFCRQHFGDTRPVLAGSSVHFDRRYAENRLTAVARLCSHRHLDSTTLIQLFDAVGLDIKTPMACESPETTHRALPDCYRSLAAARMALMYLRNYVDGMTNKKEAK